jgi:hypothetical protein
MLIADKLRLGTMLKKTHRLIIVGLMLALILGGVIFARQASKENSIIVSMEPKLEPAARGTSCQIQKPSFDEISRCSIATSGLSQMRSVCAQTLTRQRAATMKQATISQFATDTGVCEFTHAQGIDTNGGWTLNTYDVQFGAGFGPHYSVSQPSLSAAKLGEQCETFGEISFTCKFEANGECTNPLFYEKRNRTGFQCMDGVQY